MMTCTLIDYLLSFGDTHITIGSNLLEEAKKAASVKPDCCSAYLVDVFNVGFGIFLIHILGALIGPICV